jgi:hypothetical protein
MLHNKALFPLILLSERQSNILKRKGGLAMIRLSCRFLLVLLGGLALAVAASADSVSVTGQCYSGVLFPYSESAWLDGLFFEGPPQTPGYPQIADEFQINVPWGLGISPEGFVLSSYDGKLTISGRTTSFAFTPGVLSQGVVVFTTATDSLVWTDFSTGERIDMPQTGATGGGSIHFIYGESVEGSIQVSFDVPSTPVPEPGALALLSLGLLLGVAPRLRRFSGRGLPRNR